jgi:hypothetical protein
MRFATSSGMLIGMTDPADALRASVNKPATSKLAMQQGERSTTSPLSKLFEAIQRNEFYFDLFLAFSLLMFSLYATRVLQLQYGETFRDAEQIRPSAEAAARMPGAAGEGGRKLLEILAGFPTRFRSDLGYILTVLPFTSPFSVFSWRPCGSLRPMEKSFRYFCGFRCIRLLPILGGWAENDLALF